MTSVDEDVDPREELLTYEELIEGPSLPAVRRGLFPATPCGPEMGMRLPHTPYHDDPNMVRYGQKGKTVAAGIWDNGARLYAYSVDTISQNIDAEVCRLGRQATGADLTEDMDWRVSRVDLGEGIVAFQTQEWTVPDPAKEARQSLDPKDIWEYSTVRAYGIVGDRLIYMDIAYYRSTSPSAVELKVLWDAQVAKLRFHDAMRRSREVHASHEAAMSGKNAALFGVPLGASRGSSSDIWPLVD